MELYQYHIMDSLNTSIVGTACRQYIAQTLEYIHIEPSLTLL